MNRRLACVVLVTVMTAVAPALYALGAADVAVIYLEHDADSRALAYHYAARRGIASTAVFAIDLPGDAAAVKAGVFTQVYDRLQRALPSQVQALVLTWGRPYRVDCMSVTSAFAFGFDRAHCARGCQPTAANPYYGARSQRPYDDFGLRPAMLLHAGDPAATRTLIERGVSSDGGHPGGTAYLVSTADRARDTRAPRFALAERLFSRRISVRRVLPGSSAPPADVMFYFTGAARVPGLSVFGFRPGAVADHLTSAGGVLDGARQMPATAWLEAGATGSYGTVVEPCNFPQKFPDPPVMMAQYLNGDTLMEAYWKSVRWPGQGLFLGEPLARPYGPPTTD